MDLDAELYEFSMLASKLWTAHPSWMVDAIDRFGNRIDVKFIRKFWNVSREKTLNLIKQRKILDAYVFCEWVDRPKRPLELNDPVTIRSLGTLDFSTVADNLKKSFKEPDGFYLDARSLINETPQRFKSQIPPARSTST